MSMLHIDYLIIFGLILMLVLFLRWFEPRMLYYPQIPGRELDRTPSDFGLDYEDVQLTTTDNTKIHGWFLAHPSGKASQTILFFHGNAGNISHRLEKYKLLAGQRVNIFAIDYRGYGQSEGKPSERGTYRDADAAYEYLTKQRGISADNIIVYGESLGTGVSVDLASRVPVGGVILESAYTSIADVAQPMFWFLPVRLLLRNRYESLAKIGRISAPLLLLHSREDEMIPLRHAERLYERAAVNKCLTRLQGSHDATFMDSREICLRAIERFLAQVRKNASKALE